jgi:arginase
MAATFVVVPQWQGSGSSRAMRLVDGAEAIRGDLPASTTRVVAVPLEAGDSEGSGVHRMSSIAIVRDRLARTLSEIDGAAITIGGDCGVELAAVAHVLDRDVVVIWFDAHPDLNTPESSPSRAFTGMVLRTLLGDGPPPLVPAVALRPDRVILAGARAFDQEELDYLDATGITSIPAPEVGVEALAGAIEATGATSVYIHIDLDVLEPGDFTGLDYPEPFGVPATTLIETVRALVSRFTLAGAGITEFAPASDLDAVDDLPTILRIVGALTPRP